MVYLPKRSFLNYFVFNTILSNVPSILVIVLIPYLFADSFNPLFISGIVFTAYRLGNITGTYLGPSIAKYATPNKLAVVFEIFNFITAFAFAICIYKSIYSAPLFAFLYYQKGAIAGMHANTRFQWLKAISLQAPSASKISVYTGGIVQAAFGVGGALLFFTKHVSQDFFLLIFSLDLITSIISAVIFYTLTAGELPSIEKKETFNLFKILKEPKIRNFAVADFFIALAVAGTNILILRFGNEMFVGKDGYPLSLIIYSTSFLIGSYIVNETRLKNIKLHNQVLFFSISSLGIAFLSGGMKIISFFIFFLIYPLLLLGLEKSWFENLDAKIAGKAYSQRVIFLSFIWALGEVVYANINNDFEVRSIFLFIGTVLLFLLRNKNKS